MAKAPKCKLCDANHWSYEPHKWGDAEPKTLRAIVTEVVPQEASVTVDIPEEQAIVTQRGGGTGKGRARVHVSNAERQRAYRERIK